ncbi:TetR/AcrR family transcriptional regulator [Acuticoccus sediminis]|uniref:TetR/AcrR family transcriptional regulator n=1 Tax=Acuticoccus sediminis TaxID=2184697 RepID=A0A8B2NNN0_9HYPH|nr:TetR/AcrR family transcriptional regulator [Acuticoccus sediminis]
MAAAARVVGRYGYAATSIARVTEEAGVAHGTFYNYFEDRQALFDSLLPEVGRAMTDDIVAQIADASSGLEREVARFRAYCRYLQQNPGFYRILYEAEVFAPKAHEAHIQRITEGYVRSLSRAMEAGDIPEMPADELEAVVTVLLGARAYIAMRYIKSGTVPQAALDAYTRLVSKGLFER